MNEWLATNGIGGFAMGAVPSQQVPMNRRRYHGLLIAAVSPPVERVVALHSTVERVRCRDAATDLSVQQFGSAASLVTHPEGWRCLEQITADLPHRVSWRYRLGRHELTRQLTLPAGRNAAELTWTSTDASAQIITRVLTPLRDFHELSSRHDPPPQCELLDQCALRVTRGRLHLHMQLSAGSWTIDEQWWHDFHYAEEKERGQSCTEDVWSPGEFIGPLNEPLTLRVELVQPKHVVPGADLPKAPATAMTAVDRLNVAAEQFIVKRLVGRTHWHASIIAGYPWFADWGRDTMISLPGLLLSTGRFDLSRQMLMTFAQHLRNGLIPNRFDDYDGQPHYNTVDASLWFVHAVDALRQCSVAHVDAPLIDVCRAILTAYRNGTDFDIAMDEDGLIAAGSAETQLTWMDAQRDGITFTPRHGKAIEINALWHHALHCFTGMTDQPSEAAAMRALADRVAESIRTCFWNEATGCCHDVLTPDTARSTWVADDAIRPNQIFAVSLTRSPLTESQQRSVVEVVRETLLTPFGLRTLAPKHRAYRGRYEGDLLQRDAAYHQGTVWPWLIGPFAEAVLRVNNFSSHAQQEARSLIAPLIAELDRGCFGQLAEVYDGDAPHRPSGCPAQAWSVAEVLRIATLCDCT